MIKKYYKWLVWHGKITKVECKNHSFAWSGNMPCTGLLSRVYCGYWRQEDQ